MMLLVVLLRVLMLLRARKRISGGFAGGSRVRAVIGVGRFYGGVGGRRRFSFWVLDMLYSPRRPPKKKSITKNDIFK